MADPVAVATKRAKADLRLNRAVEAASQAFGIEFKRSKVPANRFPDLYAAELVENVAAFLETLTATKGKAQ